MKLIDKIKSAQEEGRVLFSFEYFPPKTEDGQNNLYARLDRMAETQPAWIDITWGAGGSTATATLEICKTAQNLVGLETMMHLTCTNLPLEQVAEALTKAKGFGLQNILALRGDPPVGKEWQKIEGGFGYAGDLVKYIRAQHGDYFGIAVAGYPEGHIQMKDYETDLRHLKAKIDAGADFVVTQLFYDVDVYFKWVNDCRALGITVPLIPGLMPIQTYAGFNRMTEMCKTKVPQAIRDALEPIKDNDEAVKKYGINLCVEMCKKLLEFGVPGLHFYTLNLERSVLSILDILGLSAGAHLRRVLPWRPSASTHRKKEDVRPIFWNNRPKSYLARTESWDDFPNGRWGDSRSPAFGDLSDYHLMSLHVSKKADSISDWGYPTTDADVYNTFVRYIKGEINQLPWNETKLAPESDLITEQLVKLNRHGFLTINSQPQVNGAPSDHPVHGWGGPNGYVFQKAYVEFFTSPANLALLQAALKKGYPSLTYIARNSKGEGFSNTKGANAVTWGVFPGKEIVQPTIVEDNAFNVWREEAFALWKQMWLSCYEENPVTSPEDPQVKEKKKTSRELLERMYNSYFLVSLVDNNFITGNIYALFDELIPQQQQVHGNVVPNSAA